MQSVKLAETWKQSQMFEQESLERQKAIHQLQSQLEDALQGQESYKGLMKRIQQQRNALEGFQSPYSFGDKTKQANALTEHAIIPAEFRISNDEQEDVKEQNDSSYNDDDKLYFVPDEPMGMRRVMSSIPILTKPNMNPIDLDGQSDMRLNHIF